MQYATPTEQHNLAEFAPLIAEMPDSEQWLDGLFENKHSILRDDPNYFVQEPSSLRTTANIHAFMLGNGEDVYSRLLPSIETAKTEVVLITCFWARSTSLNRLGQSLKKLSQRVLQEGGRKIKVFIGFSSLSLTQKLFQTSKLSGKIYKAESWPKKLGLPPATELQGLDLTIKSIFALPFSVMHPKFIIIDRKTVWLPSCNVSWESWLEGCTVLSGNIVLQFITFWQEFWVRANIGLQATNLPSPPQILEEVDDDTHVLQNAEMSGVEATFLPSPHHRNPLFRPFPWQRSAPVLATPLNLYLLNLLGSAQRSIYIQTPNLTCARVLEYILYALGRGVDIRILTSDRLMILEQLVTAGRTTKQCVKKLKGHYTKLYHQRNKSDEEAALESIGNLEIHYYRPKQSSNSGEPVQSHLKLTIVDGEHVVLGSGNLDRASWYTSQELGVAFRSTQFAGIVQQIVDHYLASRVAIA